VQSCPNPNRKGAQHEALRLNTRRHAHLAVLRERNNHSKPTDTAPTSPLIGIIPFRTPGGTLNTNGFAKTEILSKKNGSWLGTTSSEIHLDATYRYEIQLRDKWNIYIDDTRKLAFVVAPPIRPELPVAVNSKSLSHSTSSGWARFDKRHNLEELRKETSGYLENLSKSPAYIEAAKGKARITVEEFITDWLLKQRGWPDNIKPYVKVEPNIPFPEKTTLKDFLPSFITTLRTHRPGSFVPHTLE